MSRGRGLFACLAPRPPTHQAESKTNADEEAIHIVLLLGVWLHGMSGLLKPPRRPHTHLTHLHQLDQTNRLSSQQTSTNLHFSGIPHAWGLSCGATQLPMCLLETDASLGMCCWRWWLCLCARISEAAQFTSKNYQSPGNSLHDSQHTSPKTLRNPCSLQHSVPITYV